MKITASTVEMAAEHSFSSTLVQERKLRLPGTGNPNPSPREARGHGPADRLQFSRAARELAAGQFLEPAKMSSPDPAVGDSQGPVTIELRPEDQQKIKILEQLWQQLTGKEVHLEIATATAVVREAAASPGEKSPPRQPGGQVEYHLEEKYHEEETVAFHGSGIVKTADGAELAFTLELQRQRQFTRQNDFHLQIGDPRLVDPLVVNYAGPAADLAGTSFAFDLNADGRPEQLAAPGPGSGFLALDKNGDGIINDGRELFGPGSGDGFAELRRYDADGNHWLDENDPVFSRLQIMVGGGTRQQYFSLEEKGVGAICLEAAATPFAYKNDRNQLLGQLRSTGIFLREDGTAGSIQQVDLAT